MWRTRRTCWGAGAHGRYVQEGRDASKCIRAHVWHAGCVAGAWGNQEEAGEAVGVSRHIRVVLEVVGQRWAEQDASGSVRLAWGYMRRQGSLDRSGACRVGRVGVLRHIVSGRRGGRQGGRVW